MRLLINNSAWCGAFCIIVLCSIMSTGAYINIALHKPAYQLHPYQDAQYHASNAVDGLKSDLSVFGDECVESEGDQIAIWWVNLTSIQSIHHITIYFRTRDSDSGFRLFEADSFLGFSLYVSITPDIKQATLCFKDINFTKNTIPPVFNITCPVHGQYVIYRNERREDVRYPSDYSSYASNNLCEVEVYGCSRSGYFGQNCSIPCPDINCQNCHLETGNCQMCKPGFKGQRCELACDRGYFGTACIKTCGHCAELEQCSSINGSCLTGCDAGFLGETCDTPCPPGFFGQNCSDECNKTCKGCEHVKGLCTSGCHPGWKGEYCQEECDIRSFGADCIGTCGHCLDVQQCSRINGTCLTGCDAGFQGDFCKTPCDKGSYGLKCRETCGHCQDVSQCSNTNGTCLTGCEVGYQGDLCKRPCDEGTYGKGCNETCGNCRYTIPCLYTNGTCTIGCDVGYQGALCKTPCNKGRYGLGCKEMCGHCRDMDQCLNVNGTCATGCGPGYRGDLCKTPCQHGYFGEECAERCMETCAGCNNVNGLCDSGCLSGWFGYFCNKAACSREFIGNDSSEKCNNTLDIWNSGKLQTLAVHVYNESNGVCILITDNIFLFIFNLSLLLQGEHFRAKMLKCFAFFKLFLTLDNL